MMKIVITESVHRKVIRIPNFLITTSFGKKWLKNKYNINLEGSQLKQIVKALNKFKKQCNLPLVEVKSKNSEVIVLW